MLEYGIGGTERKLNNANEAFGDISPNRTIFVQKLTQDPPYSPEAVFDLKTVEEVFDHFQPTCDIDFETADGATQSETIRFNNLGDFGPKGIKTNSKFLEDLSNTEEQHLKIVKELKSNRALQNVVQNPETRQALISSIQAMIAELEAGA